MKKFWLALAGMVLILAVGLVGCSAGGTIKLDGSTLKLGMDNQQEGIWVSGEGKVKIAPDVATISVGIEAQEKSVAEAQAKAAQAMDNVMKALKNTGVAEKDIQTQYFNIQKVIRWDNDRQQEIIIGYRVINTVSAKIRDISRAGSIIDAVTAAGGDLTRIEGISFSVDDPSPYYEQARAKAVENAFAKAKKLADSAGVKLGKPTYITETSYVPGPIYRDMVKVAEGSPAVVTPISPGETEITVNVQIAYAIAD